MNNYWAYQALMARREQELDRDLEHHRLMMELRAIEEWRPSRARRLTALALAALSRGTAGVVRRLDDCVADDLGRALAPTE
jgi:hypothetical protein